MSDKNTHKNVRNSDAGTFRTERFSRNLINLPSPAGVSNISIIPLSSRKVGRIKPYGGHGRHTCVLCLSRVRCPPLPKFRFVALAFVFNQI